MSDDNSQAVSLSSRVHLVPDGDEGWRAFGTGLARGVHLTVPEVAACLQPQDQAHALGVSRWAALRAAGLIGPPDESALARRRRWTDAGWGPAIDLMEAMHAEETHAGPGVGPPLDIAGGPIVETLERNPRTRPLDQMTLLDVIPDHLALEAAQLLSVMAVLDVDGLEPGWYVDGQPAAGRGPVEADLRRIAPVAYGRAGFDVACLVVLFARCNAATSTAAQYVQAHIVGGLHLALMEGRASDRTLPFRCNYAVSTSSLTESMVLPADLVAVGAIGFGAP